MFLEYLKYLLDKDYHLIIIYIVIGTFVYQIIKSLIEKKNSKTKKKRQETIKKLILNIIKYLIVIFVSIKVLGTLGIDVTSILAGLGIASVVLGLALQDMMKDILVGISIILEDQFDIGDYVLINNFEGTVIDLGLKNTKIKNNDNVIKIIANRNISEVMNYSKISPNLVIEIPFPKDTTFKEVDKIVNSSIKKIEKLEGITEKIEKVGFNNLDPNNLKYKIVIPMKIDKHKIKTDINRIIKEELDKKTEVKNG